jgi:hypothetical protein
MGNAVGHVYMRIVLVFARLHIGQSDTMSAHSSQTHLCPHGTIAMHACLSRHTTHACSVAKERRIKGRNAGRSISRDPHQSIKSLGPETRGKSPTRQYQRGPNLKPNQRGLNLKPNQRSLNLKANQASLGPKAYNGNTGERRSRMQMDG